MFGKNKYMYREKKSNSNRKIKYLAEKGHIINLQLIQAVFVVCASM